MGKKLQYIGPHTAGIFLPGDVFVPRMGAGVEVDDDLADELLAREEDGKSTWRLAPKDADPPKSKEK